MIDRIVATRALALALGVALSIGILAIWQLNKVAPAQSIALQASRANARNLHAPGAALFAFGDFGAIDLDTLEPRNGS